jgi:ribosomal-protein-alanine N-acetyltransferase
MKAVRLINLDQDVVRKLINDQQGFELQHHASLNGAEKTVKLIALSIEGAIATRRIDPRWWTYLGVDESTGEVIGTCTFRGEPRQGVVEIGYLTFPQYRGEGYAVAMADSLVRIATVSGLVRTVVAHTLPEPNASAWILERIGMRFVGKEQDPADGWVWRWEKELTSPPQQSKLVPQSASGG